MLYMVLYMVCVVCGGGCGALRGVVYVASCI